MRSAVQHEPMRFRRAALCLLVAACQPAAAPPSAAPVTSSTSTSPPASSAAPPAAAPAPKAPTAAAPVALPTAPASFGKSRVVSPVAPYAFGLAADDRAVYGASYQGAHGTFWVGRAGGDPNVLAPTEWARDVAVEGGAVYWVVAKGGVHGGGVWTVPAAGGAAKELVASEADATAIAADATHVYWVSHGSVSGPSPMVGPKAQLRRVPKSGGAPENLAAVPTTHRIVLAGDDVYLLVGDHFGMGQVLRVPRAGGAPVELATAGDNPYDMALDDTHVYWIAQGPFETPKPAPCKRPPCPAATVAPLVERGELRRVPRAGGSVEVLEKGLVHATSVAVGGTSVLYSAGGSLIERAKSAGPPASRYPHTASSRFAVHGGEAFVLAGGRLVAFSAP